MMVSAMVAAPVMDVIAKFLAGSIPGAQVTLVRFAMQAALLLAIILLFNRAIPKWPEMRLAGFIRGILVAGAVSVFFTSLFWLPVADAVAIFFVEPLILTVFSALFLNEKVGWRRYVAVIIGLGGALLVVQPSFAQFGWPALLPLVTAILFATYLTLTSRLARDEHPLTLQLSAGISAFIFLGIVIAISSQYNVPMLTYAAPTTNEWGLLILVGLIGTFSHLLIVYAFKLAPASLLAPFHYLEIVAATILGYLIFDEFPNALKWLGIAIIVASGLYIIARERRTR